MKDFFNDYLDKINKDMTKEEKEQFLKIVPNLDNVYTLLTTKKKVYCGVEYETVQGNYFYIKEDLKGKGIVTGLAVQLTGENMGKKYLYSKQTYVSYNLKDTYNNGVLILTKENDKTMKYITVAFNKDITSVKDEELMYLKANTPNIENINFLCNLVNEELDRQAFQDALKKEEEKKQEEEWKNLPEA